MTLAEKIDETDTAALLPLPITIRAGSPRDYDGMNALFAEIDALHRQARPDIFQEFDEPARTPAHTYRARAVAVRPRTCWSRWPPTGWPLSRC